ncbi:hypothetical protein FOZ60_003631 [Perkinsus olseni]|uniref:Uncharacterized protein n=1 Tax=Perkinsus olseni TaxID=32597 RepID=A0A7J6NUS4_PEROL|nr:hypothetical protein FOZ60_003631 [Perkinsus olseni]
MALPPRETEQTLRKVTRGSNHHPQGTTTTLDQGDDTIRANKKARTEEDKRGPHKTSTTRDQDDDTAPDSNKKQSTERDNEDTFESPIDVEDIEEYSEASPSHDVQALPLGVKNQENQSRPPKRSCNSRMEKEGSNVKRKRTDSSSPISSPQYLPPESKELMEDLIQHIAAINKISQEIKGQMEGSSPKAEDHLKGKTYPAIISPMMGAVREGVEKWGKIYLPFYPMRQDKFWEGMQQLFDGYSQLHGVSKFTRTPKQLNEAFRKSCLEKLCLQTGWEKGDFSMRSTKDLSASLKGEMRKATEAIVSRASTGDYDGKSGILAIPPGEMSPIQN